jgi:hypothetical protein
LPATRCRHRAGGHGRGPATPGWMAGRCSTVENRTDMPLNVPTDRRGAGYAAPNRADAYRRNTVLRS